MGVDNIEVNTNTTQLFHAWLERSFWDEKFSVLAGLYPVDSQFYVTDATGVFLHPTGGMAAEVAQTGVNGPVHIPHQLLRVARQVAGGAEGVSAGGAGGRCVRQS